MSMEAPIYNAQGKQAGTVKLPESVFGVAWNESLIHQVVTSMQDNARTRIAHTKDRGDVRGGGKKPWQQKGTGRARHGSIRSPIWAHGGVTHGPRNEKNYTRTIPKKMRAKALAMVLSRKLKEGQVIFVESFGLTEPKTAIAKKALAALSGVEGFEKLTTKKKNAAIVAFPIPTEASMKSFRNLGNIEAADVRNLNPVVLLKHNYLVIENPEAAFAVVEARTKKSKLKASKLEAKS